MISTITAPATHPSDSIIAAAMHSGTYCCVSWTYNLLTANVPKKENAHSGNYGPFKTKNKKHDPKLIKNIQIESFSDTTLFLSIVYALPAGCQKQALQVRRGDFELWLYQTCRLDWCLTEIEPTPLIGAQDEWPYNCYGVSTQDLITYIIEAANAII